MKKSGSKPGAVGKGDSDQGRTGAKSAPGGSMAGKPWNAAARGTKEGNAELRAARGKLRSGDEIVGPTKGRSTGF